MTYSPAPTRNEDDAAASGDAGLPILGIRQDADTSPVSADGDYHAFVFNNVGRLKVAAMPGDYSPTNGNITANGGTVSCDVTKASNVMMYCTGTFSTINCTFEGSIDNGVTWFGVQAVRSNANTVESVTGNLSAAPAYAWELSVNAYTNIRVRATAYTSGTQTWRIQPGAYATEPAPAIQAHAITGTVTSTVTPASGTNYNVVTTASTNAASVKSSAGNLYEITVSNVTGTAMYVKLYNKASAPTVGTDVPILTVPVAANAIVNIPLGFVGKRFNVGIAVAVTGAIAATDTTNATAGAQVNATYL
ncbi:MAG: hypothetical protein WBP12_00725 [Candidatus Saccharimonas sp.]